MTSTYISNAGFETTTAVTANVSSAGYATIDDWTNTTTSSYSYAAVFSYGTSYYLQSSGNTVPTSGPDADDTSDTKALGVVGGWGGTVVYTQTAKEALSAGVYTLTAYVYNTGYADGTNVCTNRIGFVTSSGTTYYGSTTEFTVGSWTEEKVTFILTEETAGSFSVGIVGTSGKGSSDNPHLFISGLTLEREEITATSLTNADFESDNNITTGVVTYDYDASKNDTEYSQLQPVTGWYVLTYGNARAGATYSYKGGSFLGGPDYTAPTEGPDTENTEDTKALGLVAVWGATAQYAQPVILEAGSYTLEFYVYNSAGTNALTSNLMGISVGSTNYYATTTSYPVGEWTKETITFSLTEQTTCILSAGITNSGGSGTAPHLFIDGFTLTKTSSGFEVTNAYMTNSGFEEGDLTGWTKNTSDGDVAAHTTTNTTYATTGSVGSYLFNAWHSTVQDEILSQTLTLPAGIYVLSAELAYSLNGSGNASSAFAYLYAGTTEQAVDVSENVFVTTAVKFTVTPATDAETAEVTIGVKRNGWFKADDFHLYYFSNDETGETDAAAKLAELNNLNGVELTIAAGKYASRIFPFKPVSLPTGVKVYGCSTVNETVLTLTAVDDPAADTPYLLYSDEAVSTTLTDAAAAPANAPYTDGLLTGVITDTKIAAGTYALQTQDDKQAFYIVGENGVTLPAYRAYLTVSSSTSDEIRAFTFSNDNATAIEAVEVLDALTSGTAQIYDLNGRKLSKLQKGVNIVNGKKVILK